MARGETQKLRENSAYSLDSHTDAITQMQSQAAKPPSLVQASLKPSSVAFLLNFTLIVSGEGGGLSLHQRSSGFVAAPLQESEEQF